jgi:hypothetical protein
MNPEHILLAATEAAGQNEGIIWPWFIVGCVMLLAAIGAFFWAFRLGNLTPSQHFLLMWLLPLTSGFAAGCFVGSLKATGPIGKIAVTATGGFAVWLLSFFLLPKPVKTETVVPTVPDSISTNLTEVMSFREASIFLAKEDGYNAVFNGFDDTVLNAKINKGRMTAAGVRELIEGLKYRFSDASIKVEYRVIRDSSRGSFEISKS